MRETQCLDVEGTLGQQTIKAISFHTPSRRPEAPSFVSPSIEPPPQEDQSPSFVAQAQGQDYARADARADHYPEAYTSTSAPPRTTPIRMGSSCACPYSTSHTSTTSWAANVSMRCVWLWPRLPS